MSRVAKTDPRLVAYADVDETNSVLGVALALGAPEPEVAELLRSIQNDLFDVGADLCTPITPDPEFPPLRITAAYTERLEAACDEYNEALPKLTSFILPGRHAGRRAAAPGARGRPSGRAQRLGTAGRRRRAHQRRDGPLPQPAVGPAVHPGPRRPTPAATSSGSPARTAARTPSAPATSRAQSVGGADSTQERKPVTVELSIASSRGPSGVRDGQDDDVRGQGEVVAAGAAPALHLQLRAARAAPAGAPTARAPGTRAACRRRTRRRPPTSAATAPGAATW